MSRGLWTIEIKATLVNGQQGTVHLTADKLVTVRELREVTEKALAMCEQLQSPAESSSANVRHFSQGSRVA